MSKIKEGVSDGLSKVSLSKYFYQMIQDVTGRGKLFQMEWMFKYRNFLFLDS